ncbi:MAG: extracellular solute-binding protein [Pseudomonadota bacterium]
MNRRSLLRGVATTGSVLALNGLAPMAFAAPVEHAPVTIERLPKLSGTLTLYLGRGEGGLYENILAAIERRNPDLKLKVRRGPSTALANALVAEARMSRVRADVFWSIDASSLGLVAEQSSPAPIPADLSAQLSPAYRYKRWLPISGRIRTLPFNTGRVSRAQLPATVMQLPESDLTFGWAPAYGAFQSFITAMRILEGEDATGAWLEALASKSKPYAGEFGVVMGVSRGEADLGFANHYYTLRLKQGNAQVPVDLGFTENDAGSLLNASGAVLLNDSDLATGFVRHLLTEQVQSFLAREAFEIPLVRGVQGPQGLPPVATLKPPAIDLEALSDLKPTLALLRRVGVL